MINILDKHTRMLVDNITTTKNDRLQASYAGMALALIKNLDLVKKSKHDTKVAVLNIAYEINEVTVIDKDLLVFITSGFCEFYKEPLNFRTLINSFDDIVTVEKYVGSGLKEAIDNNIDLFRSTIIYMEEVLKTTGE